MTRDLPFLRAIVAAPGDALPRLIFADYLEDQGRDAEAAGQRWAASLGVHPSKPEGWFVRYSIDPEDRPGPLRPHSIPRTLYAADGKFPDPLYQVGNPLYYEAWFLKRCRERWHLVPEGEK